MHNVLGMIYNHMYHFCEQDINHSSLSGLICAIYKYPLFLLFIHKYLFKIFLGAPSKLYTLDIQKAFQHLQSEGALTEIPSINRQQENIPEK